MGSLLEMILWGIHHRRLRDPIRTITPEALKQRLDAGELVAILDLRHPLDFLPDPRIIPGAIRISPEELQVHHREIPRDRDVIVYCTCPRDSTSAQIAALLVDRGITRAWLLAGGFQAWRDRGYLLVEATSAASAH